ncbi:MAG: hypothetical protein BRD50_03515 [Bacteroidetes bacterium SW_11_45_7]|nr:MAG: hypothetical protein BRD50_03515 [Bacteroidetes bacterium SW_11_45_7]
MFQYVIKRILIIVPTLAVISLLAFFLFKAAPGDPVELRLQGGMQSQSGQLDSKLANEQAYISLSKKMGLHLPVFYFSITSQAYPDTLNKIYRDDERANLSRLIDQYGNWPRIEQYYQNLKDLEYSAISIAPDSTNFSRVRTIRENTNRLFKTYKDRDIQRLLGEIDSALQIESTVMMDSVPVQKNTLDTLKKDVNKLLASYKAVKEESTISRTYIPKLIWYGTDNQYHRWIFGDIPWFTENTDPANNSYGFLRGDFGDSYLDGRPVSSKIGDAIIWTMLLNIIAVLIAYMISIPVGVHTAVKKDSKFDRVSTTILFILYSLPNFWIATLLIVFLTTPEYGINLFPTYGPYSSGLADDASFFTVFFDVAHHLVLPVFCLTYTSLAFISRQMRGGMVNVISSDFIRTARAKGLNQRKVVWKHAFRNSLIPIITLFANLFPIMISGSVVIEIIFNIPGMGQLAYQSLLARDYPVVFTVLMLSAILTMVGVLVSDIIYALVDPRISYTKKS